MKHAKISFTGDRRVCLDLDGSTSEYTDLGSALADVRRRATAEETSIAVDIADGGSSRSVVISTDGSLSTSELSIVPSPAEDTDAPEVSESETVATPSVEQSTATGDSPRHDRRGSFLHRLTNPDKQSASAQRKNTAGPAETTKRRPLSMTVPSIVLACLLVLAIAWWLIPTFIGEPNGGVEESTSQVAGRSKQPALNSRPSEVAVPGFKDAAAWKTTVDPRSSVTASARGVVIVTGSQVVVLDPITGKRRYAVTMPGDIEIAADTRIEGKPALLLKAGDRAEALFDGEKSTVKYALPRGAEISLAGSSPLVSSGDRLYRFGVHGVKAIPGVENGYTPMGLDDKRVISATFDGKVSVFDGDTGAPSKFDLQKPGSDLVILRWVTAGHGRIVTVWGQPGTDLHSNSRVQLVVSDVDGGNIVSTVETPAQRIADAKWVRGQGFELAVIGPYLFNLKTGLLVRDGSAEDVRFGEPRGSLTPAVVKGTSSIISGDIAYSVNANLLAVGPEGSYAVVRSGADVIQSYMRDDTHG